MVTRPDDARKKRLLDAALGVFVRFGFRKTSMDEVAKAAGVSRQALYLHFATKEELFRAAVLQLFDAAHAAATERLGGDAPLERRLVDAYDAWFGPLVGALGAHNDELASAAKDLVGPVVAEREADLVEAVARALRRAGLAAAYKPAGLTAKQLASTLHATARGLKHCPTRESFVEAMTVAARVLCAPAKTSKR